MLRPLCDSAYLCGQHDPGGERALLDRKMAIDLRERHIILEVAFPGGHHSSVQPHEPRGRLMQPGNSGYVVWSVVTGREHDSPIDLFTLRSRSLRRSGAGADCEVEP
jgi:hypothetical protein